ncbi:MAG: hypothetical protein L0Y66_20025, partial [Myxococcaceae bacterium]|nr:hypothetical protein [Myxococcaceae bacterium]
GLLGLGACAHTQTPEQPPHGPIEFPPSSLARLLDAREALALTPEQVQRLTERNTALQETTKLLEEELAALHAEAEKTREGRRAGGRGGGMGGGMGGGRGGMGGGRGGMGGGRGAMSPEMEAARERRQTLRTLLEQLQGHDAQAYRDIEPVLDDAQKEKARVMVVERNEQLMKLLGPEKQRGMSGGGFSS